MLICGGVIFLLSLALSHACNSQSGNSKTSPTNMVSSEDSSGDESSTPSDEPIFYDITDRDYNHEEDKDEHDESKPGLVLYIINQFTPGNDTEPQGHETDIYKGNFLWTIPHMVILVILALALVILALLLVLVALECLYFCSRRRTFIKQNILSSGVLEKFNTNGKM